MSVEILYQYFLQNPSVSTDTRTLRTGDIFFALKGENFNGNKYAKQAYQKGASIVVVDENVDVPPENTVKVANVLQTLQALANHHRKTLNFKVIAITGSNGKTTTKELVQNVLSKKYTVQSTPGNFNNHIGVPLTLLGIDKKIEFAIIEMGDNHPGEIDELCKIAEPNFGLITNIGKDHLEGFGSMEANIAAKGELFTYLSNTGGIGILNTSDSVVHGLAKSLSTVLKYDNSAEPQLKNARPFLILEDAYQNEVSTQLIGLYNLENIRMAWQIGKHFSIPNTAIGEAIYQYTPKNNRSQVVETQLNTIVLDAYNANPSSVEAALESFDKAVFQKPKAIVLGDMFELGTISKAEHANIVALVEKYGFQRSLFCGNNYFEHKADFAEFYRSKDELISNLKNMPLTGFAILLKGSRGIALETLVDSL